MMLNWPRFDERKLEVSGRVGVQVYTRNDSVGRGRCISVTVDRIERLRFDLFTPAHWHRHNEKGGSPRHYFPPGQTLAEYVDLAIAVMVKDLPLLERVGSWIRTEAMT